ncbi:MULTISPECIES: hypothetical protein [unclassified Dysgonomonas]|uniref:hypothetical protein n=1 Tax=unclassified Dysgonomonas TaxID=2630389 RepID=UPI00067FC1F2|nr:MULTISPECIES: hypothetical protein [unclassified Dysgonomonas]MBD8348872.1 hypothetical protein [Dysgonomonas sp. HGC4]MBF0576343.1 hypothetical protein [Dysgonomonas sp. GY617]
MKRIVKLFFLITFISVSALASAQSFTLAELVDMAPNGEGYFSNIVTAKGYTLQENGASGLSNNYTYTHSGDSKITLITPSFDSDVRMVSWEFKTVASYNALKSELAASKYKLTNTERRNGGKYVSLFYSRPGIEVILTTDKTVDPSGIYIISVKYTNAAKYIVK